MTQKTKIRLAVLRDLSHVPEGYDQLHSVLIANVQLSVRPRPSLTEVEEVLEELENKRQVRYLNNNTLEEQKWVITDAGRFALANAQ